MSLSNAIARIILADARRFEVETAAMLRDILRDCPDAATRKVVEEILAEEESHAARLGEAREGVKAAAAVPTAADRAALPAAPAASKVSGATCDRLRDVLAKEEASVLFYSLLAKRTLIPSVRDLLNSIADQERGHARKLADHIRAVCESPRP